MPVWTCDQVENHTDERRVWRAGVPQALGGRASGSGAAAPEIDGGLRR